jgi:hypothetical protein
MSLRTDILTVEEAQNVLQDVSELFQKSTEIEIDTPALLVERLAEKFSITIQKIKITMRKGDHLIDAVGVPSLYITLTSGPGTIYINTPRQKVIEEVVTSEDGSTSVISTTQDYIDSQNSRFREGITIVVEATSSINYSGTGNQTHCIIGPIAL